MSKFDEKIEALQIARRAEFSLKWFSQIAETAFESTVEESISITAVVRRGSATSEGKVAQTYIQQAAKEFTTEILDRAEFLARTDLAIGEKLL